MLCDVSSKDYENMEREKRNVGALQLAEQEELVINLPFGKEKSNKKFELCMELYTGMQQRAWAEYVYLAIHSVDVTPAV